MLQTPSAYEGRVDTFLVNCKAAGKGSKKKVSLTSPWGSPGRPFEALPHVRHKNPVDLRSIMVSSSWGLGLKKVGMPLWV